MPEVPRLTAYERNVLHQLTLRGKYGLELVDGSGGQLSRNSVYVYLSRMEDKAFIASREVDPPAGTMGPPRRVYRITTLGRRVLKAAIAAERAFNQ